MVTLPRAARPRCLSPLAAMAAWVSAPAIERERAKAPLRLDAETIQLENVVRCAYQRPFTLHLLESTQQELPEATSLLDLSNHGFDDSFARGIDRRAGLGVDRKSTRLNSSH